MPPAEPAVVVDELVMRYGDKVAVDRLSFEVARGTITAVLGPNGAGKTTTLETCEGYRKPQGGSVRVLGLDPQRDRRALLPRIGVMLQSGGAWSGVRAKEMLDHVARLHSHPLDTGMLYERLGLGDCGSTPYRRLSGGQQQRLGLAMALVGRPELVFVDEPTAGMDPMARRTTWELLEELRADGVTVVLTTHHMDEAERLSDLVHIIDHGRVIASGTPRELTSSRKEATLRMVLPVLSAHAHDELSGILGDQLEVTLLDDAVHVSSPADGATLAAVARWYEHHEVLPVSLTLGQRTLEDVFLELTGREITP
nr:ABC transporter ATP-binding protein [Nocardioides jishulii]